MKKFILTIVVLLQAAISANAMSYEQAREQALFLTDKMAYELDLTEEQYEAAYEVNLDYLMGVNTVDDCFGAYWRQRNLDLSYILFDWQYRSFCAAEYFYRPLYWGDGFWHFRIFAHYPHRTFFYFGRPAFYHSYRGGHAWHMNGGHSWYHGRTYASHNHGMRGGYDRGGYRNIQHGWRPGDGGNRGIRGGQQINGQRQPQHNSINGQRQPQHSVNGRPSSMSSHESSTRSTVGNGTQRQSQSGYTPSRTFSGSNGPAVNRSTGTVSRSTSSTIQRSSSLSAPSRSSVSAPSRSSVSSSSMRSSSSSYSGGSHGGSSFSGGSRGGSFGGGHSGGSHSGGRR